VLDNLVQAQLPAREIGALVDRLDMARIPPSGSDGIWSRQPRRQEW
jgi:hypothetical protein